MTLNLSMPGQDELKPRITVFGVGGAGGNAVNNMIDKELDGVEFVVANTDAQALQQAQASNKIQLGIKATEGLGAGACASVGAQAAEENIEQIVDHLAGAHMCFITAGMGGGTGTGAAPIIAHAARELGVLTVGVVTKPFQFEGAKRMRQAEAGIESLQKMVDTLIIIPNQNLFRLATEKTTFTEAFSMADDVLYQGVKGVTDLMVRPGLMNLDFADIRSVMNEMGKAMMGTGEDSGEDRAVKAAEKAIANPLLDEISLRGAKGVLINITGGHDLTLFELDEAANKIREEVDADANIIVGSTLDTEMEGIMRVSVVATGIDAEHDRLDTPVHRRKLSEPLKAANPENAAEEGQAVANEPSLFEEIEREEPVHAHQDTFAPQSYSYEQDAAEDMNDDLPEPAYRPEVAVEEETVHQNDVPAPHMVHEPGRPSEETMARLRAAVNKEPQPGYERRPPMSQEPHANPFARADTPEEKPRFGLNGLLGRMTGHTTNTSQEQPRAARQQPTVQARPMRHAAPEVDEHEEDQVEIPAFLRRQAN